jgi:serine/threonine protein kinase
VKAQIALPEGYLLHHYRLAKVLGVGGFSIVYLAYDTQKQTRVVIKEYLPSNQATRRDGTTVEALTGDSSSTFRLGIKRFFEEAAALAKIKHPNIVCVTDFFRENNTVYMVMHYESGKDLRSYIKRHARLSEKFIRTVFPELLSGLQALHAHGLLHLDIKPANIYLRPGGHPMLLDFGAAQMAFVEKKRGVQTLTQGFAPPEQHAQGHLGPWTDLYALGASMWACMSGKAPPPSPERAQRDMLKPAVKQFARHYSRPLLEIVDHCLHLNQLERPQNADELLAAFQALPDDLDSDSFLKRLLPWRKRAP